MFKEGSAHPSLRISDSLKACLYCGWGLNADLSKNLISCSHLTPLSVRAGAWLWWCEFVVREIAHATQHIGIFHFKDLDSMFNSLIQFSDKPVIKPWACVVVSDTTRPCHSFYAALPLGGFTQGFSLGLLKYWSDIACTRLAPPPPFTDRTGICTKWNLLGSRCFPPSHQCRWSDGRYLLKAPAALVWSREESCCQQPSCL